MRCVSSAGHYGDVELRLDFLHPILYHLQLAQAQVQTQPVEKLIRSQVCERIFRPFQEGICQVLAEPLDVSRLSLEFMVRVAAMARSGYQKGQQGKFRREVAHATILTQ
jgi:hypothetical protein